MSILTSGRLRDKLLWCLRQAFVASLRRVGKFSSSEIELHLSILQTNGRIEDGIAYMRGNVESFAIIDSISRPLDGHAIQINVISDDITKPESLCEI